MAPLPRVHVIRKPGRTFLYLRYRDPVTGREHARSAATKDTREAERAAARWERELRDSRELGPGAVLWTEFRERYETEVLSAHSAGTDSKASTALASIEAFAKPHRLADLTSSQIAQWVAFLRDGTRQETTIAGYVRTLAAALRWAQSVNLLTAVPSLPKIRSGKRKSIMKGRPITEAELEQYVAAVPLVPRCVDHPAPWQRLIRGLWLSGLRLGEALKLSWDRPDGMLVDLSGRRPMMRVHSEDEKGRSDRLLPITPDFAAFLEATATTPSGKRKGLVFPLPKEKKRNGDTWSISRVSEILGDIGAASGVIVNDRTGKTVSAHDLRRSFGFRWSRLVMPPILMELMRHEDISTTMQFYVGLNAESTADTVWEAWGKAGETAEIPTETTLGNVAETTAKELDTPGDTSKPVTNGTRRKIQT